MTNMIIKTIANYIKKHHPDLLDVHYPVKARITRVYENGAVVDIQLLSSNLTDDTDMPEIPSVKYPLKTVIEKATIINAAEILAAGQPIAFPEFLEIETQDIPVVGDIVRVGFYYNDPSQPYIERQV